MIVNKEYFENTLNTMFDDAESFNNSIASKFSLDKEHDAIITKDACLYFHNCVQKLESIKYDKEVFMYVLSVNRECLPMKLD